MNAWEKFLAALKTLGTVIPTEKEKDAKDQFEKLTQNPDQGGDGLTKFLEDLKKQQTAPTADNTAKILETVLGELAAVKEQNKNLADLLADEKTSRENNIKARKDADDAAKAKKVADALDKAEKEGKFAKADRDAWKVRLEKDFEEWNKELEAKPVSKQFQSEKGNQQQQQQQQQQAPVHSGNSILNSIASQNQNAALPELK